MFIKNNKELNLFKKAVEGCRNAVLLLTPEGIQYNLKNPAEYIKGVAELMRERKDRMEAEIYTRGFYDDMMMYDFMNKCRALA